MQTSVPLQDPFSYALWPILLLVVILLFISLVAVVWGILVLIKKVYKAPKKEIKAPRPVTKNKVTVKQEYLAKITSLEEDLKTEKIDVRECYQRLSVYIREFAYQMTGIDVTKFTLSEIKEIKMSQLDELIQEYYAPEFARESKGNAMISIAKTKKVIETWK